METNHNDRRNALITLIVGCALLAAAWILFSTRTSADITSDTLTKAIKKETPLSLPEYAVFLCASERGCPARWRDPDTGEVHLTMMRHGDMIYTGSELRWEPINNPDGTSRWEMVWERGRNGTSTIPDGTNCPPFFTPSYLECSHGCHTVQTEHSPSMSPVTQPVDDDYCTVKVGGWIAPIQGLECFVEYGRLEVPVVFPYTGWHVSWTETLPCSSSVSHSFACGKCGCTVWQGEMGCQDPAAPAPMSTNAREGVKRD